MTTLKYRVQSCLEQAEAIKKEYPNVYNVAFDVDEVPYNEVKELADEKGQSVCFKNGKGVFHFSEGMAMVFVSSKKVIVSEPVIVEE